MATNLRILFRWLFPLLAVVLLLQISGYLSALNRVLRLPSHAEHPLVDLGYATYRGEYVYGRYTRFLGLRYAAPPLGPLRWRSPSPPPVLSGVQQATNPPAQCPQGMLGTRRVNPFIEASHPNPHGRRAPVNGDTSEDCLLLNVYAPLDFVGKALPVIVFIHGGGYLGGRGDASGQDILEESDDGVVVVAIQYRLGIFGFLAGQAVKDSGALNAGLLDQQAALQWVQTHISQFGGDPTRVTLWGQSAGAGSVLQQVIANDGKTSPPLFKRSIASSTYMPSQYLYNDPIPEFWYRTVVESARCSSASDTLDCLRHLSTHELQRVNAEMTGRAMEGTANFVPVVDGSFIKSSPVNALSQGKTNGDAMLVTTLTNEALQFVPPDPHRTIADYVRGMYPHLSDKHVKDAVQLYSTFGGEYKGTVAVVNESIFLCAAYNLLKAFSARAWKNNLAVPPALHSNDLRYYFPGSGGPPNYSNEKFRKAMVHFIIAFAVEGDPNHTLEDTITPDWSTFEYGSKTGRIEMLFNRTEGGRPVVEPVLADERVIERCEFWTSVSKETGQ